MQYFWQANLNIIPENDRLVVHWLEVMRILWIKFKEDFKKNRILKIQREIWYAPNTTDATMIIHGPGRVIVPGLLLLMNCMAIAGMWTVFLGQNFATQVLYICVANGAFYIVCYSGLKVCRKNFVECTYPCDLRKWKYFCWSPFLHADMAWGMPKRFMDSATFISFGIFRFVGNCDVLLYGVR